MPDAPSFRLRNTLTREVEPLVPSQTDADGTPVLRFYSCGPTVYSYAHVGNFRTFLTADLVVRTGRALGWRVDYVSNVTDVGHLTEDDVADGGGEDKMARALASKEGEAFANVWDLARHYTDALLSDWRSLGLIEPNVRPRATEHVREQIRAVEGLMERGHAYETEDGVYFHVPSFPDYGKLSGNSDAERLAAGAAGASREVVQDESKRDPRDFALWKKDPGHLMQWFSPFGWGFPGWHLECSVMAQKYLGETIDLHGGGEDLTFPHHECEIAQAEALTGEPFARMWIHTRFLQVEGEKMSKSKGNFLTVRDLTATPEEGGREDWGAPVDPLALRLLLISGQYGKPFNLTKKALADAAKNRQRYAEALEAVREAGESGPAGDPEITEGLRETLAWPTTSTRPSRWRRRSAAPTPSSAWPASRTASPPPPRRPRWSTSSAWTTCSASSASRQTARTRTTPPTRWRKRSTRCSRPASRRARIRTGPAPTPSATKSTRSASS